MAVTARNYSQPTVLRRDSFPMRLYEKAKRLGVWNPAEIDFTQDRADWEAMDGERRRAIVRLSARFLAGEEAVTVDLLPLVLAIARQGRLEEEMFLTTFLFEEAKHTDFFTRWMQEVAGSPPIPPAPEPSVRLFDEVLPEAMNALLEDDSPAAIARASVTYNMVIEGVLAETGYHSYHKSLAMNDLMPGLCAGLVHIKRDESRHIAYGVYLLSRLVAEDEAVWPAIEERMRELRPLIDEIIRAPYAAYKNGRSPFGHPVDEFAEFAANQFRKRYERIARARQSTLAEIEATTDPEDVEDLLTPV